MRMAACIPVVAWALTACSPPAQQEPQDTGPAIPEAMQQVQRLDLTCAAFAGLTRDAAAQRFGAANITTETLPGAEGETYQGTVVYATDPARRLIIVFSDDGRVASVSANSPNSAWRIADGVSMGGLLPEVERANGRAFKLWGFGWDYGGWVSDWNGGALAPQNNCMTRVRFDPGNDARGAQGDGEFSSSDSAIRAAEPRVSELGLAFTTPE